MVSAPGLFANRATSCGETRAENCRVMRALSLEVTIAMAAVPSAHDAIGAIAGPTSGMLRCKSLNANRPADQSQTATRMAEANALQPVASRHAQSEAIPPNKKMASGCIQSGAASRE